MPIHADSDVLSDVLRAIRLTSSYQFCVVPSGNWYLESDTHPRNLNGHAGGRTISFHILVDGECWVDIGTGKTMLAAGDIVVFPYDSWHRMGVGEGGPLIVPSEKLPPRPWRSVPIARYGNGKDFVRVLCGRLECDAVNFAPLRRSLPALIHHHGRGAADTPWLRATIDQLAREVDHPRTGGLSMIERLTEVVFIEVLRHRIMMAGSTGWLAALGDEALGRCLALMHADPARTWTLADLARQSGMSRSALSERFETVLETSPIKYLRDWRLYLASVQLATTETVISKIAEDAGYNAVAAFSRAFSRSYGKPPAAFRASNSGS